MNEQKRSIAGAWELAMLPNEEVVANGFSPRTVEELEAYCIKRIPATVPGNFELDLYAAGLAPDPYFSQAPWEYQQYENRHLWYTVRFECEQTADKDTFLRFEGIDTVSEIYLNGELLGTTDNMFIPHEFEVCGKLAVGENQLLVHIIPTAIYARRFELKPMNKAQIHGMPSLHVRKAPYMFGWDIMPRFISGGIWKPVSIVRKPEERLEQFYLYTYNYKPEKNKAYLNAFFEIHTPRDDISELRVIIEGRCGDSVLYTEKRPWHTYDNVVINVIDPELWYPKNAGEPKLYDINVRLERNGVLCDEMSFRFGIRTVELVRTSTTDADGNGEFVFKINGKKIFCRGTNWVPTDAFPSRHDDYLLRDLEMADDIHCNIIRCWGGAMYETDEFYDFCDQKGIMVWQDFCMGCATYPQDDDFAQKVYIEAASVIKRLRNHASLILWAGDNENDQVYAMSRARQDPNFNRLSRQVLAAAVREYDVVRPYLPSSPFIDQEAFATKKPTSEDHLWGPRDYFKGNYYSKSVCHFASETGYHGCPSPKSLERFIAKDKLWPIFDENGVANDDWICHAAEMEPGMSGPYAYRIGLMARQVVTMFGGMPDGLDDFARQSQISQAEAKKYFIERFRLSKWRRTGIIWWNLVDGWPQISDAVVDWYGSKKLAYHYIKRSQTPLCLMFDEPIDGNMTLYAVNDLQEDKNVRYKVIDLTADTVIANEELVAMADSSVAGISVPYVENSVLYIEWETDDGIKGNNHYTTTTKNISYDRYMTDIKKVGYDEFEGF